MALSASEQKLLDKLKAKAERADSGPVSRSLRASIDLGDAAQVKLAKKLGFLDDDDDDDDDDKGGDDDDDKKDETPKRKGYFNS